MSSEFDSEYLALVAGIERVNKIFRDSVVSFDIDQVEVDSATTAIREINKRLGTDYKVSDITKYWALVDILRENHADIEDPESFAINIWNDPEVVGSAQPLSGAVLLSKYLLDNGIVAHRITSRPAILKKTSFEWYRKNMPWVDENLIHIQDNGNEIKMDFKVAEIKRLGVDFHFEDSWEHAQEIVLKTKARVVLVPQPWNISNIIGEHDKSDMILAPIADWKVSAKLARVYVGLTGLI